MLSSYEIDQKKRAKLIREITGPTRLRETSSEPTIESWAPGWWHGDEDATAANMAAMQALKRK
jgi:hypothetical protein